VDLNKDVYSEFWRWAMAQIKVLLVDDEREFVTSLARRLARRNIETRIATSGEQALHQIQERIPDVVVVDLNMPEIDGPEIVRRIKVMHPRIHVVALTGEPWGKKVKDVLQLGALGCLEKPLNIDELVALIMKVEGSDLAE